MCPAQRNSKAGHPHIQHIKSGSWSTLTWYASVELLIVGKLKRTDYKGKTTLSKKVYCILQCWVVLYFYVAKSGWIILGMITTSATSQNWKKNPCFQSKNTIHHQLLHHNRTLISNNKIHTCLGNLMIKINVMHVYGSRHIYCVIVSSEHIYLHLV